MRNRRSNRFGKKITAAVLALTLVVSGICLLPSDNGEVLASGENGESEEKSFIIERYDNIAAYRAEGNYTAPKPKTNGCEDWLFAGWYTSAECTAAYKGTTGPAYAKFVPSDVLSVKCQVTSGTTADKTETSKMRLVTTVDNLRYDEVGFDVNYKGNELNVPITTVYKVIESNDQGVAYPYGPTIFSEASGYFATATLINLKNEDFGEPIYIQPYWITLDGTKVYGVRRYARVEDSYLNIVNVPVRLYSDKQVDSGTVSVSYDSQSFEWKENYTTTMIGETATTTPGLENGKLVGNVTKTDGENSTITFEVSNADAVTADGLLANLRFQVKDGADLSQEKIFGVTANLKNGEDDVTVLASSVVYTVPGAMKVSDLDIVGKAGEYFASYDWQGYPGSTANIIQNQETPSKELTEDDWTALKTAGYSGKSADKTVNSVTLDQDEKPNGGNTWRSLGFGFPATTDGQLKALMKNESVRDKYYISVWVRSSHDAQSELEIDTFSEQGKRWGYTFGGDEKVVLHVNTWTEIKVPLSIGDISGAYSDADTEVLPLYLFFNWLSVPNADAFPEGTKLTIDIYGAEVKYNAIETKQDTPVDLSIDPSIVGTSTEYGYKIYDGDTLLVKGTDYTANGTAVSVFHPGNYRVEYTVIDKAYTKQMTICRDLIVTEKKEFSLGAMEYYMNHDCTAGIDGNTTKKGLKPERSSLTETEYEALVDAGFKGERAESIERISIDMSDFENGNQARTVGIMFPDTADGKLKSYANDPEMQSDYYVSVWVKFSRKSTTKVGDDSWGTDAHAMVVDRENIMQANASGKGLGRTFEKDVWTEIRIPLTDVASAYNNLDSWHSSGERVFGIYLGWLSDVESGGDVYPSDITLNIDVYGARFVKNAENE